MHLLMAIMLRLDSPSLQRMCGLFDLLGHHWSSHHGGGGDGSPPDPHVGAFIVSGVIICLSTAGLLVFGGPLLAVFVRRVRSLLWMIPSLNTAVYLLSDLLRGYPGGLYGRMRPPGIWYTLVEFSLALLLGLLVALVVALIAACVRWLVRKMRGQNADHGVPAPAESGR